jgi:hypothetical protein
MESFQPGMNFNPVKRAEIVSQWVVPEKIHTPPRRKFLPSGGGGEKKLFLIIVNVLEHPKGVGGLTSYFLCEGGMDVFWNDPITWQVRPT